MVEDCQKFLKIIKNLEPYLVEFEENKSMKTKNYWNNCAVGGNICWLVIVIIYNEYTFSTNNRIWRAWTCVGDIFLQFKGKS